MKGGTQAFVTEDYIVIQELVNPSPTLWEEISDQQQRVRGGVKGVPAEKSDRIAPEVVVVVQAETQAQLAVPHPVQFGQAGRG